MSEADEFIFQEDTSLPIERLSKQDKEDELDYDNAPDSLKSKSKSQSKKRTFTETQTQTQTQTETTDTTERNETEKRKKKRKNTSSEAPKERIPGVWIGNLNFLTTENSLRSFLSKCGDITDIELPRFGPNNKGFAKVYFSTQEEAEKAIALSETLLDSRQVLIKDVHDYKKKGNLKGTRFVQSSKHAAPCNFVFVGNLSFETTKLSLRRALKRYREPKIFLSRFDDTKRSKGWGYVEFKSVEEATKFVESHPFVDGREVRAEYAQRPDTLKSNERQKKKKSHPTKTSTEN